MAATLQAQHDGKVNAAMVQAGIHEIAVMNDEILERHKASLDAQITRLSNDKYLQSDAINSDPALTTALAERLSAERQLTQSASGLNNALKELDIGLTKAQTAMLRMMAGKNADNTDKSPEQKAQEVGAASIIEGSAISPNDLTGKTVDYSAKTPTDPVDAFWKRLFNIPDYKDGPASKLDTTQQNVFGLPQLQLKLDTITEALGTPDLANTWRMVDRGPVAWNMNEMMGRVDERRAWNQAVQASGVTNTTNTTNVTNNLNSSPVINLNGIGLDSPALADTISRQVFEDTQKMLGHVNTNLTESK